ncbi:RfaL protein [Reinekea sp. MED297]|uniref:RfaL protein n=1 Tax=Reinekea blandensis MED297 TaxID=314283 RepID=A4BIW8_9GAMM|nr:RfaL protein [Reinekea sp. MED297] [Reinekea blandensis MED297]
MIFNRFARPFSRQEKWLLAAMFLLPFSTFVRLLFDLSYSPSAFDIQSRFIIVLPLILLLVRYGFNRHWLIAGMGVAVVIALFYMVFLTLDGQSRPKVNMNQITSANLMVYLGFAVVAFSMVHVFEHKGSRWWLVVGGSVLLAALIAAVLSKSRGAWLSVPFFVGSSLWLFRQHFKRWQLVAIVLVTVLGGLTVAYLPGSPVLPRIQEGISDANRYFTTGEVTRSIDTRLNMWETAIEAFKLNPLFGLSEKGLQKFEREGGVAKYLEKYGHQHSDFFDILAKRGLVGLAFFYGFWAVFFWAFNGYTSPGYREAGILLGVGYLVFGLTETTTGNYAAMSLLAVQTALLFGGGHREWLLVHKPEVLERFSMYWPEQEVLVGKGE